MRSAIGPSLVELLEAGEHVVDEVVGVLLRSICVENGWLACRHVDEMVVVGLVVPLDLVLLLGALRGEAMLATEVLDDSSLLVVHLAVIGDPHGETSGLAIGLGGLGFTPFSEANLLVLEFDVSVLEHVSDCLSAGLRREVHKSGHSVSSFFG